MKLVNFFPILFVISFAENTAAKVPWRMGIYKSAESDNHHEAKTYSLPIAENSTKDNHDESGKAHVKEKAQTLLKLKQFFSTFKKYKSVNLAFLGR